MNWIDINNGNFLDDPTAEMVRDAFEKVNNFNTFASPILNGGVKIPEIFRQFTSSTGTLEQQAADSINAGAVFTIPAGSFGVVSFLQMEGTEMLKYSFILREGARSYGVGQFAIDYADVIAIPPRVISVPTEATFDLGNINTANVEDFVNGSGPYTVAGLAVFEAVQNGNDKIWLFTGGNGNWGDGAQPVTADMFVDLDNQDPIPNIGDSKWEVTGILPLRVPNQTEWDNERLSWGSNNAAGAFGSPLKIPMAGFRDNNGALDDVDTRGVYYSSTTTIQSVRYIGFTATSAIITSIQRVYGGSIRLIVNGTFTLQEFQDNYENKTFEFQGLTYGFVYNPTTNKIWVDRNLGASQVATSSTDSDAYGDLYQWGRSPEGHQLRTSPTHNGDTLGKPSTANESGAWDGDFITTNASGLNWLNPPNDNLWQGLNGFVDSFGEIGQEKLIGKNGLKASYDDLLDKPDITGNSPLENYSFDGYERLVEQDYAMSEPNLARLANGNIILVYRKSDFTHLGNDGEIAGRISADNGVTWGNEFIIFSDAVDDRAPSVGVLPNGNIVVMFSRYDRNTPAFIDLGYVLSTDNGATWGSYNVLQAFTNTIAVFGDFVTRGTDVYFLVYTFLPTETRLYKSTDNFATTPTFTTIITDTTYLLVEPFLVDIGGGKSIIICRNESTVAGQPSHIQFNSNDGLSFTLKGATNLWSDKEKPVRSPVDLKYDSERNNLIVTTTERGPDRLRNNENNEVRIYIQDADVVFADETAYEQKHNLPRPLPNETEMYGYPSVISTDAGYFGAVTDKRLRHEKEPLNIDEWTSIYFFRLDKVNTISELINKKIPNSKVAIQNGYAYGKDYVDYFSIAKTSLVDDYVRIKDASANKQKVITDADVVANVYTVTYLDHNFELIFNRAVNTDISYASATQAGVAPSGLQFAVRCKGAGTVTNKWQSPLKFNTTGEADIVFNQGDFFLVERELLTSNFFIDG